ncbi:hypothetical protein Fmac_013554 [Flemingia macrophylla]|uniref:pyruvate, phosphate dikinase n=1 Tax=Flemingia macrophylla TaxID=520843 RepID=A0ABD1MUF0_9FABA
MASLNIHHSLSRRDEDRILREQNFDRNMSQPLPKQRVFSFGKGKSEGNKAMKSLLGGKGANLAEMATIGLSVPPGLTISTEACQEYQQNGKKLPDGLWEEVLEGLHAVENEMGATLGNPSKPLLLSVRSGAAISMPGMMDTVLNLGLNDEVVAGLAAKSGERFAYDSYRRFLDMFGNVGEDVVAGIRTPEDLEVMKTCMPEAYKELVENCEILEKHYKDMMDIEFTVQENRLWMLQCRSGKRTGKGAVKIAIDMVNEGLVDARSAIKMVEPRHLDQLLHPQFEDPSTYKDNVITIGLPASPGAAVGQVVFSAFDAEEWHKQGKSAILVRNETSSEDVGGMHAAAGILTARGGMTSHAAVVARGWGKCCVSGCSDIRVNDTEKVFVVGDNVIREGEWISLNGSTGEVILGNQPLSPPALTDDLGTFMSWVDEIRNLKVMANADTPEDAVKARQNGAQGIGLCRTEHMVCPHPLMLVFLLCMADELADNNVEIRKFMFDILFLILGNSNSVNRLGISYPELTEMQARAIFQAAVSVSNHGITVLPEIMELRHQVIIIRDVADKVLSEMGSYVSYKVGTMIEVPRAALLADEIAKEAEFFSFGTNDLTQMTFGYSRDDVGKFLPIYLSSGILQHDPFEVLDQKGVGQLIKMCTEKGRAARPNLKVGICGEHGGEPSSVAFFAKIGLDYREALFQTHDSLEHLAIMKRLPGSLPQHMLKS